MFGLNWQPFNETEEQRIVEAITEAEKQTSGELRVHVDRYCKTDPYIKARNQFEHLGMTNTVQRNGVLIYVSIDDKKFAILGDEGINNLVGDDFWNSTKELMLSHFKNNALVEGICAGISEVGTKLKHHFPYDRNDENELPNTVSYG